MKEENAHSRPSQFLGQARIQATNGRLPSHRDLRQHRCVQKPKAHKDRVFSGGLRPAWLVLVLLVLLAPVGCGRRPAGGTPAHSPAYPREDLLIG